MGILAITNNFSDPIPKNIFNNIFIFICLGSWITGVISGFYNLGKAKPLKGKLDGFLIFEMDKIKIQEETFTLEQIKNIEISNDDYYGKMNGSGRGNFGPALSNGTDNTLKLKLLSGELKTYSYEMYDGNDFQKVKNELMNYYLNGKIEFSNLAYVLGDRNRKEIDILKEDIEKIATLQNSHP
ncbi:MAG: hypothetical protein ABIQ27_12580 [Flavobacterium sp.]|uniref:hypothetical protein n=1 Tax=Flavobacterium sp. TaxID=239 RepID=UPI0032676D2E